jgi:hypothetical protein
LDHQSLVALFRRIILAGPPLVLGAGINLGCSQFDPCATEPSQATTTVAVSQLDAGSGDASIDDLIARCQASSSDCTALCEDAVAHSPHYIYQEPFKSCGLTTVDGGPAVRVVYTPLCAGGRCPEGLAPPASGVARDPLGAWLSANAHLEGASIAAFEILSIELGSHRAPAPLIEAARAAAADERHHADTIGRLAAGRGVVPPVVSVNRGPIRDIESIARENAVEGCVRETYAAMLAWRQARAAADPAIRSAMAGIARDETRHAALAWAVDDWSQLLLTPAGRRRVRGARREAIEALMDAPVTGLSRVDLAEAGLPDEDEAACMAGELGAALV